MKQILGIYLILVAIVFSFNVKAEEVDAEIEKLSYCYGVYHRTKSVEEFLRRDQLLYASEEYKDMLKRPAFLKGKEEADSLSPTEKTKCYHRVYVFLDSLYTNKNDLIDSVPYCFGYVSRARESDYIPVFCQKSCNLNPYKNCIEKCIPDFTQNLNKNRVRKGTKDAKNVDPAQYVRCLKVLDDFL